VPPPADASPPHHPGVGEFDERVRACLRAGDVDGATTLALEAFGPELLGFLLAVLRSPADAGDAFSDASIDIWRGLPGFHWQSSLRTWLYVLTRRAAFRVARDPKRRRERAVPLSEVSGISKLAVLLRNTTLPRLEAQHDALAEIRGKLDPDDQVLLILRVDRNMPWRDVAEVLEQGTPDPTAAELKATAVRLRKRFMRIKEQIREMAKKAGV
jgi:RNA polymerase sigma-70 factor, ECF subfamily